MATRTAASSTALNSACVISPDSNPFRAPTRSGGRRRLPTTSARHVLSSPTTPSPRLGQDVCGHTERAVRGRHPAVDRRLQQDLFQLVNRDPVPQRPPHVHGQLLIAIEGNQHRHRDAAARTPVEARSRPDLTPCIAREEVLELIAQGRLRGLHAIYIRVAQYRAAHLHAFLLLISQVNSSRLKSDGKEHGLALPL